MTHEGVEKHVEYYANFNYEIIIQESKWIWDTLVSYMDENAWFNSKDWLVLILKIGLWYL